VAPLTFRAETELPELALSGLFERAHRTSAIGGRADIPRNHSTDALFYEYTP